MKKLYIVETRQPIYGLDGIVGPLTTPTEISFKNVLEMVNRGYIIYQVNPYDVNEKIRVTKSNINTIRFTVSRSRAALQQKQNRENLELIKPLNFSNQESTVEERVVVKENNAKNNNVDKKVTKPDKFTK